MPRVISVSADQSQISVDNTAPAANGSDVVNVFVTAKQNRVDANLEALPFGPSLPASEVVITVTPSTGVTITQPTGLLDDSGATQGSFVSTNAATVEVSATVRGVAVTGNAAVVVGGGAPVGEGLFFSDDFAGGVKTNDNGFTWNSTTSAVAVELAPDASGDYALRFRFGPDPDDPAEGSDSTAEQRFNLGQDLAEVWIQYEVWIPTNFVYRAQTSSPTNNKFFTIWNTVYGSGSGTWQSSFEYTRVSDSAARIRPMASTQYRTSITSNAGTGWSNPDNDKAFIGGAGPIAIGDWYQIRLHFKAASTGGATDGVMEMWIDGVLFAQATGALRNFDDIGTPVLRNGYFFGWSNSGFTDATDFYVRGGTNGPKFYNADPGW